MRGICLRLFCLLIGGLGLSQPALAEDFVIERVELTRRDSQILLDADIRYPLNDTALEALENGVPLVFVTHIEVRERGAWIWEPDLVEIRLRSLVRYHPLSGLYELRNIGSDSGHSFATRDAVLTALGEIRDLPLIDLARIPAGSRNNVLINTYLDIEALPLPLRPMAHVTPSWHLESDSWLQPLTP